MAELLRAGANYSLHGDHIELWLKRGKMAGTVSFDKEIEDGFIMEPAARLRREEAQQISDALWDAGIRPTQGRQSEGVTAAQGRHLADMRAIAFAKLNIDQPPLDAGLPAGS